MKKWLWLLPIAAVLAFAGCSMPGNVYLTFDWAFYPSNWWGTDPNIDTPGVADTLAPGFDYLTLPGDYYFTYTHDDINWNEIWYELTAHKGAGSPGQDAIFMMYLTAYPGYPGFWQAQGLAPSGGSSAPKASRSVMQSGKTFDKSGYEYKQLGQYTQTQGGYTLTVRYGVWEPKK